MLLLLSVSVLPPSCFLHFFIKRFLLVYFGTSVIHHVATAGSLEDQLTVLIFSDDSTINRGIDQGKHPNTQVSCPAEQKSTNEKSYLHENASTTLHLGLCPTEISPINAVLRTLVRLKEYR